MEIDPSLPSASTPSFERNPPKGRTKKKVKSTNPPKNQEAMLTSSEMIMQRPAGLPYSHLQTQVTMPRNKPCHNWLARCTPITQCWVTITRNIPSLRTQLLIIIVSHSPSGSLHCSNLVFKITSLAHIMSIQIYIIQDQWHHNNLVSATCQPMVAPLSSVD